jgi:hypothetical protein
MKELIILILCIVAIAVATYYRKEHMTNQDVISIMQTYGSKEETSSSPTKRHPKIPEQPIAGPKSGGMGPAPSIDPSHRGRHGYGVYPQIYGPDESMEPGTNGKVCSTSGKHESDNVEDCTYDYNPDLLMAFPTSGPPQPFLTDFSGFQK